MKRGFDQPGRGGQIQPFSFRDNRGVRIYTRAVGPILPQRYVIGPIPVLSVPTVDNPSRPSYNGASEPPRTEGPPSWFLSSPFPRRLP